MLTAGPVLLAPMAASLIETSNAALPKARTPMPL